MAASIPNWFHIGRDPRKTTASQHRLGVARHSGPPNSPHAPSGSRSSITLADRSLAAVSVDSGRFADVHDIRVTATTSNRNAEYVFQPAATVETALVCLEVYRRDGTWRLRAVGQGYADGLAGLARDFGVDVACPSARTPNDRVRRGSCRVWTRSRRTC